MVKMPVCVHVGLRLAAHVNEEWEAARLAELAELGIEVRWIGPDLGDAGVVDEATQSAWLAEADAIMMVGHVHIDEELLERCLRLTYVCSFAVGYDSVDVDACTARNIYVTSGVSQRQCQPLRTPPAAGPNAAALRRLDRSHRPQPMLLFSC